MLLRTLLAVAVLLVPEVVGQTNWDSISRNLLLNYSSHLPAVPSTPLAWSGDRSLPFTLQSLEPSDMRNQSNICWRNQPANPTWPLDAISAGSFSVDGALTVCRVNTEEGKNMFRFLTKAVIFNIWKRATAMPTWLQYRFPVPDNAIPETVTISLDTRYALNLFGGQGPCPANATATSCPLCSEGPWDRSVRPGYHVLVGITGTPTYTILGPFMDRTLALDLKQVPLIRDRGVGIQEVVITLFVFNQYPVNATVTFDSQGKCSMGNNFNIMPKSVSMTTRSLFNPPRLPPNVHPRLLGTDEEWLAKFVDPWTSLPCDTQGTVDWGGVIDYKRVFEESTIGGSRCNWRAPIPSSLYNHTQIRGRYVNGSVVTSMVPSGSSYQVLFLLRWLRACHRLRPSSTCPFSLAETLDVSANFIRVELQFFSSWVWENQGLGFDIGSYDAFKYWSLFADIFWSDLTSAQLALISNKMSSLIDIFNRHFDTNHWALMNGNNWTPFLCTPAMFWAVTFHHHDNRTLGVMHRIQDVMYLHRPMWLSDGVYAEGVAMYSIMALDASMELLRLIQTSTGAGLPQLPWDSIARLVNYHIASMAPDSRLIDFGDSHMSRGWGTLTTLRAFLSPNITGLGQADLDPCLLREFFRNSWFPNINIFTLEPELARTWSAITSQCADHLSASGRVTIGHFPQGGYGSLRSFAPSKAGRDLGRTLSRNTVSRLENFNFTFLALEARPNAFPHSEVDFGTIVWAANGIRYLYDSSYGTIANFFAGRSNQFDNNPAGHNTLVVREAFLPNSTTRNTCQFDLEQGTITQESYGEVIGLRLDGSAVYGSGRPNGWLSFFDRISIPLQGGHFLLLDSFATHPSRGALFVDNYFYTITRTGGAPAPSTCQYYFDHMNVSLTSSAQAAILAPICSSLQRVGTAERTGVVFGYSQQGASFINDGIIEFEIMWSQRDRRHRFRYANPAPVTRDLRAFVLYSHDVDATRTAYANPVSVCGTTADTLCLDVLLDGILTRVRIAGTSTRPYVVSVDTNATTPLNFNKLGDKTFSFVPQRSASFAPVEGTEDVDVQGDAQPDNQADPKDANDRSSSSSTSTNLKYYVLAGLGAACVSMFAFITMRARTAKRVSTVAPETEMHVDLQMFENPVFTPSDE